MNKEQIDALINKIDNAVQNIIFAFDNYMDDVDALQTVIDNYDEVLLNSRYALYQENNIDEIYQGE